MPEWISVEDRLPEASGNVLICTKTGYMAVIAFSKKYGAFNHFDTLGEPGETAMRDVTHWMPLPDLPEGVRRDE